MLKQHLREACALSALALGLVTSSAAQAQRTTAEPPATTPDAVAAAPAEQDIIVTGSLIRGSREDSAAPVDVISSRELAQQGAPSAIDLLKNLPTSTGVIGDANQLDARAGGTEGIASVNLRGFGAQRTLVLLNGRRIVEAGTINPSVDVNLLPSGAISRIEVLKDGAAATYGSDAIAGVVNFITRTDQQGFLVSGDYRRIRGSDGDYGGNVSYGHNAGGFHFLASFGYQHRSELRATDRDFAVQPYSNNPQGSYSGGGNPGNFDFNGPSVGGVAFVRDLGCEALGGFRTLAGSTTDRCFNNFSQFANLVEPEDRYQAYAEAKLDISDRLSLAVSGLYGRTTTQGATSPTFLPTQPPSANAANGNTGFFVIPTYAPALKDYCAAYGAAAGCNVGADGTPLTAATAFPILFRPALLGGNALYKDQDSRGSSIIPRKGESVRFTADLSWAVTSDINLDAGFTYSSYKRRQAFADTFGDLFQNALSGFGGANCAYASSASRAGLSDAQLAAAAGTNGCTFFNPFSTAVQSNAVTGATNPNYVGTRSPAGANLAPGAGLVNDLATLSNFYRTAASYATTRLLVGDLVLSGKTGVTLPGGDLSFALGSQVRRNTFDITWTDNNNLAVFPCPGTPLNPVATCASQTGAYGFQGTNLNRSAGNTVYALFGELRAPIIRSVDLQLSARYEHYGEGIGSTFNPQARVRVQVAPWLALRAGGGTTFRGPPSQQLSGNQTSVAVIGSAFRAIDTNGNPALKPEKADTYSAGVIVNQGRFNASVDYYNYKFKGPIEGEPVAGIVNALFGASGTANCGNPAYAALQSRFTFTGAGCGVANVQRLRTQFINSADVNTSGIDFQAQFKLPVGSGSVTAGLAGTYIVQYKIGNVIAEGIAVQPGFDAAGKLNYQTTAYPLPKLKGNVFLQGIYGIHSARLQLNHISGYDDQRASLFLPNTAALAGAAVTAGQHIGRYDTVDFTYLVSLRSKTTISLSALNIFDKAPPFARVDYNYDPFTASPLGFTLKLGVSQAF